MKKISTQEFEEILKIDKESFSYNYDQERMKEALKYYQCLKIKSKDKVASFLLYKFEIGKIFIRRIAVSPKFRRKGFGQKMVEMIFQKARKRKLSTIYAFSRVSNVKGIEFFKKMGFQVKNRIEKYYPPNDESAFILEKKL